MLHIPAHPHRKGVAYVGGRTSEGRAQAKGADGRRAQTGCGWG